MEDIKVHPYQIIAELFYFPDDDYPDKTRQSMRMLQVHYPDLVAAFYPFLNFVQQTEPNRLREIFMRTFDVQALCCMDLGYVLFGEDYTRGNILANLNKELHKTGIDCHGELADRLPNILQLLSVLDDEELKAELVSFLLKPALHKMIKEFLPDRIEHKEKIYQKFHHTVLEKNDTWINKFRIPIEIILNMVETDYPELEAAEIGKENDFMESVKSEFKNQMKNKKF